MKICSVEPFSSLGLHRVEIFKSQKRAQSGNEITVFQGERISVVDIDMGSGFTKVKTDGNIGLFHK